MNTWGIAKICDTVANYYCVGARDFLSRNRSRRFAHCRQIAMYLAREHGDYSLMDIGLYLGRDHTTVLHGVLAVARRIDADWELRTQIRVLRETLGVPEPPWVDDGTEPIGCA
jgi:chromosomal replication initiator protein